MLSIVKMDLDSDPLSDEDNIKSEEIDIKEEPIGKGGITNNVIHCLELIPIVYTTRLDEMTVLESYSYPAEIHPREATNRIIRESKPLLRTLPRNPKRKRRNIQRFRQMKAILQEIYYPSMKINTNDETDMIVTEEFNTQIDLSSVKSEIQDEATFEKTEPKDECKYSELLKLCKPCSVMIGTRCDKVIHAGQELQANKVQKSRLAQRQSTDDEELLITFPSLLVDRSLCKIPEKNASKENKAKHPKTDKIPTRFRNSIPTKIIHKTGVKVADLSHINQRLMRNGFLELHDIYSKERHFYYTDNESNLLDYFKATFDDLDIAKTQFECNYIAENCCWIKRDEALNFLYPKVLIYPNLRFMRRPHPCKPGACICCCRKKENIKKLHFFSDKGYKTGLIDNDKEIVDLEDEIDKNIININRTPKLNSTEWLRDLLTKRNTDNNDKAKTLITKALSYNKPLPKKLAENRRLLTIQKEETQNTVIILRNFAMDVTEIYAINLDGDIETYIKTTCYNNTSQPDVRKLLKKPNAINESVCCWFKREEIITKLHNAKELHPSAVKFIRTNHTCPSKECTCCCKPITKQKAILTDIRLPLRKSWNTALKSFRPAYEAECQPGVKKPPMNVSVSAAGLPLYDPPPLSSVLPDKPSTYQSEEDCVITSITTIPTFQTPLEKPTVPVAPTMPVVTPSTPLASMQSIFVTDVVDSDELSQEVNSLITSILDRFKDVRLTINDEGKVAAALNTPVHTLSTVELKVLVNILSYAQNQVNLLGLKGNPGMSLSNIINLKVNDQANSNLDPQSVYKSFGKNVKVNTNAQNESLQSINVNKIPSAFVQQPVLASAPQTYSYFSNLTSARNQHFTDAFSSFLTSKNDPNTSTESFAPVIENVFTLKEETDPEPSSTTVWYRKPAVQKTIVSNSSENTMDTSSDSDTNNDYKRKNTEAQTSISKKLRVVSPAKLGAATSNPEGIAAAQLQSHMPTVDFVSKINNQVPLLVNTQMQPFVNGPLPTLPSQPMLIINPLNTPSSLMVRGGGTVSVSVPFTNTNNLIDISNEPNITNTPMPIIVNSSSTSLITGASNASMDEGDDTLESPIVLPVASKDDPEDEFGDVIDDADVNNDGEVDYNVDNEIEDNEAELDYGINNETEEKYSPDNEEEEDCILGF